VGRTSPRRAKEIAARTVNKAARAFRRVPDEEREPVRDMSSSRRGGLRSHSGSGGQTYRQPYAKAKRRGVEGRSEKARRRLTG